MTTRSTFSLAAVAAASLVLAACGGSGGAAASAEDKRAQFQEAGLKHAECMRRNGIDMPDPKPGSNGLLLKADEDLDPERLRRAEEACRKHLKDLPAPEMSEADEREFQDKALRHARCMREQGVDFPDPKFGAGGRVTIELGRDIRPEDPSFRAAEDKCSKYMGGPKGPQRLGP